MPNTEPTTFPAKPPGGITISSGTILVIGTTKITLNTCAEVVFTPA